ncbi:MAG: hypothetical protein JO356_11620, partial [Acidobacteria bacterium]|nr:hypothetical protein [Acidobacteriota bacterium]
EDVEFAIRVSFPDGEIGYTGQALTKYRRHPSGASGNLSREQIARNEANCLQTLANKLPLNGAQRVLLEREIAALEAELAMMGAYSCLRARQFPQALDRLKQANTFYRDFRILAASLALRVFPHWTARFLLSRRNSPTLP